MFRHSIYSAIFLTPNLLVRSKITSTPLPYGPVGAAPDIAFVGPYPLNDHSKLSNLDAAGGHDAIYNRSFTSVNDMLSYAGVETGGRYSTGGTTWEYLGASSGGLSDFKALNAWHTSDFGVPYNNGEDVRASLSAMASLIPDDGANIVFTSGLYTLDATGESPTIQAPVRGMLLERDNVNISAYGCDFRMIGIPKSYLISIDDFGSSGRDIFTFFTFLRNGNCSFFGGRFFGENEDNTPFRFQSPRAKGIGAIGVDSLKVRDSKFFSILGNGVNGTPSDGTIDGMYKPLHRLDVDGVESDNSWEGAVNFMGNTFKCSLVNSELTNSTNGFEGASDGLVVSGNKMIGNRNGCSISGKNFSVTGNTIDNEEISDSIGMILSSSASALVQNGVISGNQISNFAQFGLTVFPTASKILASGNFFESEVQGGGTSICINITGTPTNSIDDFDFAGNTVKTDANWGVSVSYNNSSNVSGNIVEGQVQQSVIAQTGNDGCRFVSNVCDNVIVVSGDTNYEQGNVTPNSGREFRQNISIGSVPTGQMWLVGDRIYNRITFPGYDWAFVVRTAGPDGTAAFTSLGVV